MRGSRRCLSRPLARARAAERRNGTIFIPATVLDNAYVNRDYVKKLKRLSGWKRKAWLLGDWDVAAGQFFSNWKQRSHVWDIATRGDLKIQPGWRVWLAMDYGFQHWQMVYLFAEDGDGNLYVLDEHGARGWQPQQHDAAIRAMLARHGIEPWRLACFVAGHDIWNTNPEGTNTASKYEAMGWKLTRADVDRINGASEILIRLGDLEAKLPNRIIISSRCGRLIECLPALQHDPACPERPKKWDADEEGEGGDDAYDAFRYGCMCANRKLSQAWNF